MRRPLSVLMGTHRWRGYAVAAMASAMLAAGAVCGSPDRQAARTAPGAAPPSVVADAPTYNAPPWAPSPPPVWRTPAPGPTQPGLFADGVTNLARVGTAAWKTYSNSKYGFTFKYPVAWQFAESDSAGHYGPNGEPSYPLHSVSVKNPAAEQGKKIPGVNCTPGVAPNDCVGAPPGLLAFAVEIVRSVPAGFNGCAFQGAIAADAATLDGRTGARCVSEYPNDRSRTVAISFMLGDGNDLEIQLSRGNTVTPAQQAVLETVLSTFTFLPAPRPGATP